MFLGNKPDGRGSDIMEEVFVWRSAVIKFYRILHMLRSEAFQQAMTVFIKNEDDEEKRLQTQDLWSKLVTRTSDVFGDVRKIYAKLLECADKFYVLFHPTMVWLKKFRSSFLPLVFSVIQNRILFFGSWCI